MKLTLQEWDELVSKHLHMIEAGAEICERHARQLYGLPEWETMAADQLSHVERVLRDALLRVARARQMMGGKQRVD